MDVQTSQQENTCLLFGLGRIGLPLSLVLAEAGFNVLAIEKNEKTVEVLTGGEEPFYEPGMKELLDKHLNKNFFVYNHQYFLENLKKFQEAGYIIMAVGMNLDLASKKPDLTVLRQATEDLLKAGLKGKTIILRTTVPLVTTDSIKQELEKQSGLEESKDFHLIFAPERLAEGKAIEEETNLPKIIGAYSDSGFEKASELFSKVGGEIIKIGQPKMAEFVKLIDNSWRNLTFAYANDLSVMAREHGLDAFGAIKAANSGYARNNIPLPGPVSGYCLWKDPLIFEHSFAEITKERGFPSLSFAGRQVNDWLFKYIVQKVPKGNVLVLGLSFKKDVDDYRFSHSVAIIKELLNKGCSVRVMDPYLNRNNYTKLPEDLNAIACSTLEQGLDNIDAIILATNHQEYGQPFAQEIAQKLSQSPKEVMVFDLWRAWPDLAANKNINYQTL